MIDLDGVTKTFGETVAVEDIDLTCPSGEVTVLIGPSGCGKSTILRLMLGLIDADCGAIQVADRDVVEGGDRRELRRRIGYVIQSGGLFPHLTARENVRLMADQIGWPERRIEGKLRELADLTHFPTDGLDRYPAQLSGGQQQRVSLMRALMLDPEVLLLDEPLGALDPMIRAELQKELKAIFADLDKTVVLVTHDMNEAAYFGDEIVLLREGRIAQTGTLRELLESPADSFVSKFINAQRSTLAEMSTEA